jgi:hypothetical protein
MGGVAMKPAWILPLFVVGLGCQGTSGLHYDRVHVSVVDEWGEGTEVVPSDHCLILPVLLGSKVRHQFRLDPQLELIVDGDRDGVVVHFDGSNTQRRIRTTELASSQPRVDVKSATGRSYQVTVVSGCPAQPEE